MMDQRVRALNEQPVRRKANYVLYWCRWNRRAEFNHALLFASTLANQMNLPLLVYQRITTSYPTACDRFHTFELEGVAECARSLGDLGAGFTCHVPRKRG